MDIHKEWDQLNTKLFSNKSLKNEEIMNAITSQSSSVIAKVKQGLKIKSYWCAGFVAMFLALMFTARGNMEQVVVIAIVAALYIVGFFVINKASRDLDANIKSDGNVLSSLQENAKLFKRALNIEKGLFLYTSPVIIICSLFYGRMERGATYAELINDPKFLMTIIICSAILVPLAFIMGKYLNNKAFTPLMEELDGNIGKLQGIEFLKEVG